MNFFFDRNLSFRLARMLDAFELDHAVRHHDDRFEKNTLDEEWIRTLGSDDDDWFVISGDIRILQRERERLTLRTSDLTFFSLAKGWLNIPIEVQAWQLVRIWPKIIKEAEQSRTPTVFEVRLRTNKLLSLGPTRHLRAK